MHLDGFQLDAGDAQQLAARWFRETLAELEASGDYGIYLVRSVESVADQATGQAMDVPSWGTVQSLVDEASVSASGILESLAKAAARQETRTREDKVFSKAELQRMFDSPLFKGGWKPARADFGRALYWLPLLMVYTGARREELAQLLVGDVGRCADSGFWYVSLRPDGEKSVKSASSRRRIPLHSDLLELGFVRYVESLPEGGRVFPRLVEHASNGLGYGVGLAWGRYLRKTLGMTFEADPCHGFRHTFKTLCREAHIETAVQDWITGHATPGVGASYGTTPLTRMAEELKKFPSIARMAGLLPT